MFTKIRNAQRRGFTLVELMIVVAIIGVLAAIAIPAFVQYLKNSKVAEVGGIMGTMTDGARAYFEGDQQYSLEDDHWHVAVTTAGEKNKRPGMPVGFNAKVFPGGDDATLQTSENFPAGGGQVMPEIQPATNAGALIARAMNLDIREALYFGYNYVADGTGNAATADFTACHHFKGNSETATSTCKVGDDGDAELSVHTVIQRCYVDNDGVSCDPRYTVNEFE